MGIEAGIMVPHPPLIIPEVGKGEEKKIQATIQAYHQAAEKVAEIQPDTIVVISPHSVLYRDYFHISPGNILTGNMGQFRASKVKMEVRCDTEFVESLYQEGERLQMPWGTLGERKEELDHGTMVPLYFINQYYTNYRLVRIGLSGLSLPLHYRLGQAIQKTAQVLDRRTVLVASGDLSHYLKEDGPYGYHKEGPEYDRQIMEIMGAGEFGGLFEFSEGFCERAGECGHRSFTIMAGALDQLQVTAQRLSYEGPFGVGYGICTYEVTGEDPSRNFLEQYKDTNKKDRDLRREQEDAYVALARETLEHYVAKGEMPRLSQNLPREMLTTRAGAFVSIHEDGQLRGCIGTISPVYDCIAREIMENAVSAGTRDPRFHPVWEQELDFLEYSVDILGEPEEITSLEELDVKKYGVIVTKGRKRGLLLPDLEGVENVYQQVAIAKEKAGIGREDRDIRLERFQVIRHGKKD